MSVPQQALDIIASTESMLSVMLNQRVKLTMSFHDIPFDKHYVRELVCNTYGVSWDKIISRRRDQYIVQARMVYCYLAKHYANEKVISIGEDINRDHSSVCLGIKRVQGFMDIKDEYIKGIYPLIEALTKMKAV